MAGLEIARFDVRCDDDRDHLVVAEPGRARRRVTALSHMGRTTHADEQINAHRPSDVSSSILSRYLPRQDCEFVARYDFCEPAA